MLEKFNEFTQKKKSIQDRKFKLKKQMARLDKEQQQLKMREIQKSYSKFINGPSAF